MKCFNTLIVISSPRPSLLVSWIDPALTAHRSTCGDWALHSVHFSSSFFIVSLSSFVITSSIMIRFMLIALYFVIGDDTGPPCIILFLVRISVLSCCYSSSLHVTDLPLRVIVLSAQSGKLSGYLLFMLSSAEAASSEVLTLQCYCLSHGHCLWSGSSSRSGSGSWLLFLVMLVMLVVLW